MALIRQRVCAGWSEPLLVTLTTLLEISYCNSIILLCKPLVFYGFYLMELYHSKTGSSCDKITCIKIVGRIVFNFIKAHSSFKTHFKCSKHTLKTFLLLFFYQVLPY